MKKLTKQIIVAFYMTATMIIAATVTVMFMLDKPIISGICIAVLIIFIVMGTVFNFTINKKLLESENNLQVLENQEVMEAYCSGKNVEDMPKRSVKIAKLIRDITKNNSNTEILQKQIEYSALQNQINPHFLYNTLESIRGQAMMNDQDEIAEMTEKLSKYFRYCISTRGDFVRIYDEIQNVKDYFFIMRYRFEDRFQMTIDMEDEKIVQYYIPKMTFQPIVENAIFHGLEHVTENGNLKIRIYNTDKKISIVVQDDGIGMDEETLAKLMMKINGDFVANEAVSARSGIALTNVNARLKLYFGEAYGISIHSTLNCGTDVTIAVPIVDDRERVRLQMDE